MKNKELIRLSKLMSEKNICSRREADRLIAKGLVKVDGTVVSELGTKVSPQAQIELTSEASNTLNQFKTIVLHKPLGFLSSPQKDSSYPWALKLITKENYSGDISQLPLDLKDSLENIGPVGRLDINSTGLLLLTQNGTLAKKVIGEHSHVEKEYLVRIKGKLSSHGLKLLRSGLRLDGKALKPAQVRWINNDQLQFILTEGKKRQIRRMCQAVNVEVTALKRVRIGPIKLGDLKKGHWNFINPKL